MLFTETQAGETWCPMVRNQEDVEQPSGNRYSTKMGEYGLTDGNWNKCVASSCMMWRWAIMDDGQTEPTGYCGLAGRP